VLVHAEYLRSVMTEVPSPRAFTSDGGGTGLPSRYPIDDAFTYHDHRGMGAT